MPLPCYLACRATPQSPNLLMSPPVHMMDNLKILDILKGKAKSN